MAPRPRRQPADPGGSGRAYEEAPPPAASSDSGPTHTGRVPSRSGQRYEVDPETGEVYQVGPAPIGVAPDYVAAVRPSGNILPTQGVPGGPAAGQTMPRLPGYFDGDEWSLFIGLSPETIAAMQEAMQEAGYISVNATLNYGKWDGTTASAMREILAVANAEGQDWQVAFEASVADAVGSGYLTAERQAEADALAEAERARQPTSLPPPMLANPDELRAVVDQVARRVLGKKADEEFTNRFIAEYQTYESTRYYNQHWDPEQRQWVQQNTTQATPADLAAEQALLGDYGDEAEASQMSNVMDVVESMLAGPFGGA